MINSRSTLLGNLVKNVWTIALSHSTSSNSSRRDMTTYIMIIAVRVISKVAITYPERTFCRSTTTMISSSSYSGGHVDGHERVEADQKVVKSSNLVEVLKVVSAPCDNPAQREERERFRSMLIFSKRDVSECAFRSIQSILPFQLARTPGVVITCPGTLGPLGPPASRELSSGRAAPALAQDYPACSP